MPVGRWEAPGYDPGQPDVVDVRLVPVLRDAWYRWHRVEHPTELRAQLEWIQRRTPEGRAGRPADAIGVDPSRYNAWLTWAIGLRDKRTHRRLGVEPSPKSRAKIEQVLARARGESTRGTPTRAVVTAAISWAGYQNGVGHLEGRAPALTRTRTTTLDQLDLSTSSREWADFEDPAAAQAFAGAVYDRYGAWVDLYGAAIEIELKP